MAEIIIWILVSDERQAQIFTKEAGRNTAIQSRFGLSDGLRPVGKPILADKPCELPFIRKIAAILNHGRTTRRYHRVALIAPLPVLVNLKKLLHKTARLSIKAELIT